MIHVSGVFLLKRVRVDTKSQTTHLQVKDSRGQIYNRFTTERKLLDPQDITRYKAQYQYTEEFDSDR